MDTSGFYKLDMANGGLLYAPNFVDTPTCSMARTDETHSLSLQDGWLWCADDAAAYAFFAITPTAQPWVVSAAQAKITLYQVGLLDTIQTLMNAAPAPVKLAWENTANFSRTSPMVLSMQGQMGWTDIQLDALFTAASEIVT